MRLRFTIRDLFWLVLVVALAIGWWVDRRHTVLESSKAAWEKDHYPSAHFSIQLPPKVTKITADSSEKNHSEKLHQVPDAEK